MRIKNKEINQRRHRKEQKIKDAQRELRAKFGDKKTAPAPSTGPVKKSAPKKTEAAPKKAEAAAKKAPAAAAAEKKAAPKKAPAKKAETKTAEPASE